MLLFVYGTLKEGESNHHWLNGAKKVCDGVVFGLRLHQGPGFPYAFKVNDYTAVTHGEVYKIEDLRQCDILEGYPNHYNRSKVEVKVSSGVSTIAWVYHKPTVPRGDVIESGVWKGRQ